MPAELEGRVIASFRAVGGPGRSFLDRARALIARMKTLGGMHVGWDVMKLTFAFEATKFPVVLDAAIARGPDTEGDEPLWAVGIAQGDLRPLNEAGSPLTESGLLWWGPPIVAASALSGLARPGEILCAQTVPALRAGELVTSGLRIARDGTLRVRGVRIDRRQPWRRTAAENLTLMAEPRLFRGHLPRVEMEPGALVLVRADPGGGGTRLLSELASRAPRALIVSPVGSGFEPLGALRRALGRSIGRELNPLLLELAAPLEALLQGNGVPLEVAARLVAAFLWPRHSGANSLLVIDDAKAVDPATLEACVRAVQQNPSFGVIARLDATSGLPSVLAPLPKAAEHEIPPLSREGAEDIAVGCAAGMLDALARGRWARLGGGNPLAIVQAVTLGIAKGDITWSDGRATPRSRAAGRGKALPAAKWIRQRANAENTPARVVLSLLAVVGGEARIGFLSRVLERAGLRIDLIGTITQLERSRWIVAQEPMAGNDVSPGGERAVAFPSRTHHKALFNTLEDDARRRLHVAIARVIEEEEGPLGRVEGAWHAAQGGEGPRASAALLEGARAAANAGLEASCTQLIAFARRVDPSCEESALELLASAPERAPSQRPPLVSLPPSPSPSATASVTAPPWSFPSAPPATDTVEEPDSMVEHAMIVLPEEADSMVEHVMFVPPGQSHAAHPDLEANGEEPSHASETTTLSNAPPRREGAESVPPMTNDGLPPAVDADDLVAVGDSEPPESTLESEVAASGVPPAPGSGLTEGNARFTSSPPSSVPGSRIAMRLGELAKEALLAADNAALERWVDGLRATGESPAFTERMGAMARLGRGDIGDALRVLRRTRTQLHPTDHRRRCQTSLALGVALNVAGRPQEALLEGMDALARARQIGDERGAQACLAFLAKLYTSVQRPDEAERLLGF